MLFDSPKDSVFAEILVLINTFGFLGVNWAPKQTKLLNFGYVAFSLKFQFLKDFSNTAFFFTRTNSGKIFSTIEPYF